MGAIALLVLMWAGTSHTSLSVDIINKCCPQGQSLKDNFQCVESGHQWFYMNFTYGFPNCDFLMVTVNESDVVSCIDNSFERGSIVGLKCKTDPFRFKAPEVHYVRKCCTIERSYDAVQQSCWGERNTEPRPPKEFFNVLMSGYKGIVDIRVGAPKCAEGYVLADHLVHFNNVRREESESIVFQQYGDHPKIFNPDEVCMDFTERHEILVIRACQPAEIVCQPNGKLICIWKCCAEGKALVSNASLDCVQSTRPMESPKFFDMSSGRPVEYETTNPAFYFDGPCSDKFVLNPEEQSADVHHIGIDGLLYMSTVPVGVSDYCVEDVYNVEEGLDGIQVFKCFVDYDADMRAIMAVYGYGMSVSVMFLFLTFVVYSCLPSLRNLHGKTLMCYISSLLCAYISHTFIYHWSPTEIWMCKAIGFFDNFAFLAAFFWLNVISFDIWWNFGALRPNKSQGNDKKRLVAYNLFGWGMAACLTVLAILSQETDVFPEYMRADMGINYCWYEKGTYGIYIFFVVPTSTSQVCNLVFFALTAHHCAKVRNELLRMAHTNADETRFKADKKKFIMNMKLFLVMGVSWVLENVSYWDLNNDYNIFFWSDLINSLQGLFIFSIFILKKKVLKAFVRKAKGVFGLGKPGRHRPSSTSSTVFTVMSNPSKSISTGRPPPLRKCCSDSRLSIVHHPPPVRHNKMCHLRTFSTSSNNTLSVVHDLRSKPNSSFING